MTPLRKTTSTHAPLLAAPSVLALTAVALAVPMAAQAAAAQGDAAGITPAAGPKPPATAPLPSTPPQDPPQAPVARNPQQPAAPGNRLPEVLVTELPPDERRQLSEVPIDNPGARARIGPDEMARSTGWSIQSALRRTPGVHIQDETGSDSLPNIAIRGVTNGAEGAWRSINLGMYVDGIPLAPAPYGQPGNSLFPLAMERVYGVDVQRGGGGVRYGPNNVAGVVNFLTRPIPTDPTLVARVRADTFENNSYYTAVGATEGAFGALLEGVYKHGETFRDNGDYTLQNYALKTRYEASSSVRVLAQVETFDDDSDLSDGLSLAAYRANPRQSTAPQNRFRGEQDRVNLKLEWDVDADTRFELITYAFDGNRTFFLGTPTDHANAPLQFVQATPRPIRTVAIQPQVTHVYDLGGATGELHAGVRYLQEDIVRSVRRQFPNGTEQLRSEEQYDYYTGSAWVENALRFEDWTVTPGVRFEYVEIDGRNRANTNAALVGLETTKSFAEALPSLTVARKMSDAWGLYAGAQATFAAPQAPQISITNNPQDISAQYAWVYETGSRTRTADGLLGTDLSLFQIEYDDRLVQDPDQFDVFVNAGSSRHRGVELALDSDLTAAGLAGVSLWTTTTYTESTFTNGAFDGNRFAGAPTWLASWGLRYLHEPTGLWIGCDGVYVGAAFSDAENTRAINAAGTRGLRPTYEIWNASIGWDHKFSSQTEVNVLAGARNVFDEDWFEIRSGRGIYPGAPPSYVFQLGVTHRF